MKTILKLTPLALALCIASSFAAEFVGLALPAALEPLPTFIGFVMSVVVLTAFTDYSRAGAEPAGRRARPQTSWPRLVPQAANALAA